MKPYWDTSALLKLYVPEADSAQFAAHLGATAISTSQLTQWELLRAIARKEIEGAIPPGSTETVFAKFRSDVNSDRVLLLAVDGAVEAIFRSIVLQLHRRTPAIVIRTADAIHVATALNARADEVVTTDSRMREGAVALGLKIFP
jgi:predicted nucleic acid-binding protein